MSDFSHHILIRALRRQSTERTPVWIMRQAGRYLPEYRKLRETHDFLSMYKTPEVAAEVTIQPVDLIGVDAAILFSDILVVPEAMGMNLVFSDGRGPVFPTPIRTSEQIDRLLSLDGYSHLEFVLSAIQRVKTTLRDRAPLIGFCGAPWTLAVYMVEGSGSKEFTNIKQMMFRQPGLLHRLLEKLTFCVSNYLKAQIKTGIDALQIFDTWAGIVSTDDYKEFSLRYIQMIVDELKGSNVPKILFAKGQGILAEELSGLGVDALSIDWQTDLAWAKKQAKGRVALQGNLDPSALYAHPEMVRSQVMKILFKYGKGNGHIFNLGHGILPDTPVENVKVLVQTLKKESGQFH